jgi:tetratricopeptide (TPR) repeat protein
LDATDFSTPADERLILTARRQFEAAAERAAQLRARQRGSTATSRTQPAGATTGDFPGYEITGEVFRGGQGVVYRGIQRTTRRDVAIKVLHGGQFATTQERIRFEREAWILAQLRHPNVVTVHDSGVANGHAYIIMDYIAGRPLDDYVRAQRDGRPPREILMLFSTICDAVHAAHVRGITHRDLKPANVRVDEQGQPHVLDFGLAKLTDNAAEPGSSALAMTQTGQFVGSLPWAAPEQAAGPLDRIDLRTDVYALGVMLYQMLTGEFPYPLGRSPRAILDHILHSAPVPPRTVRRDIADDVERIVLKCLQKEPERRYQTAGELARDLRHYLADEPIDAKRDSTAYVVRKWLGRHRVAVGIAGAFTAVVLAGSGTSAVLWRLAASQRDAAQLARNDETRQRDLALASAARAHVEEKKAEAVNTFLQQMLESIDPAKSGGRDVTVREIIDAAAARVRADELANEPEVDAQVRLTIGSTYLALGRYDDAEQCTRAAEQIVREKLGAVHPLMLRVRTALGNLLFRQGRYAEAEAAFRELRGDLETSLGPDDPSVLAVNRSLGFALLEQNKLAEAEMLLRAALERATRALGAQHLTTLQTEDTLGIVLRTLDRPEEAAPLQLAAVEGLRQTLGDDHPVTLAVMNNVGLTLRFLHRYPEAEEWLRRALEIDLRVFGENHPETLKVVSNLSTVVWYEHKLEEAEELTRRSMVVGRRVLAPSHPQVLNSENNLAIILKGLGRYDELATLLAELVDARRRNLGEPNPETIRVEDYRRDVLNTLGRSNELREFMTDLLARWQAAALPPDAPATVLHRYADLLLTCEPPDLRDPATALDAARRAVDASAGAAHQDTLAQAYQANGDYPRAIAAQRAALDALSPTHEHRRGVLEEGLANLLRASGDLPAAEEWLQTLVARRRESNPDGGQDVEIALSLLGAVLLDEQRPLDAERVLRGCLELRRARLPKDHVLIATAMSQYGAALTQAARYEEAEPLLLEGYRRLRADTTAPEARLREARARLAHLYEAWGRPDESVSWRE